MGQPVTTRPNQNTHFYMRNLKGTTGLRCRCGSWMKHWRNGANSRRARCAVVGCTGEGEIGAHVVSVDERTDTQWWIAPFCRSCNDSRNENHMYLEARITLVAANKAVTCDRDDWFFLQD